MPPMPKLMTQAELYPPAEQSSLRTLVSAVLTGERDWNQSGKVLIRRALRTEERRAIEGRQRELTPWILPGDKGKKRDAILAMLMGFGGPTTNIAEAAEITTQYVNMCADVPAWAVARACMRFSSGKVTAEDLGEKAFSYSYRPSTAHVHKIAAHIAQEVIEEHARLGWTLDAIEAPKPKEDNELGRARLLKRISEWRDKRKTDQAAADEQRLGRRRVKDEARDQHHLDQRRQEYVDAGLTPPETKNGIITSLAMMLKMGWRIEEIGEETVLVAPTPRAVEVPKQAETKQEIPF
jgi:hypothetical protein